MNPNENEPTPPLTDEEREHRRVRYAQYWASKRVAEEAAALAVPDITASVAPDEIVVYVSVGALHRNGVVDIEEWCDDETWEWFASEDGWVERNCGDRLSDAEMAERLNEHRPYDAISGWLADVGQLQYRGTAFDAALALVLSHVGCDGRGVSCAIQGLIGMRGSAASTSKRHCLNVRETILNCARGDIRADGWRRRCGTAFWRKPPLKALSAMSVVLLGSAANSLRTA